MNSELSPNRDDLTKEYATDEIVVEWQPRLCIHSRNCVRALPAVFDDSRRPWVQVDAATADEVEAAVALCPSGALRARRRGASGVSHAEAPEVRASADGPLLVSGGVRVTDAAGNVLYEGERGRTLPLRWFEQQALLRRHAQEKRLPWLTAS